MNHSRKCHKSPLTEGPISLPSWAHSLHTRAAARREPQVFRRYGHGNHLESTDVGFKEGREISKTYKIECDHLLDKCVRAHLRDDGDSGSFLAL